ncbi:hypothetical protein OHA72_58530 [Dactylosporangium sp. NBC_01737]|nr:hypothetical protein OHA72_58530 [Dactylosporangium sp. NBC_01737]
MAAPQVGVQLPVRVHRAQPVRRGHGQSALADPAGADQQHDRRGGGGVVEPLDDLFEQRAPPRQLDRRRQLPRHRPRGRRVHLPSPQDEPLRPAQQRTRLHPDVVDETPVRAAVDGERLGPATRTGQRQHLLAVQPFRVRMRGHQRLDLAQHGVVVAERERGVQLQLGRREPLPVQRLAGLPGGRAVEVGERRSAPQRQRAVQQRHRRGVVARLGRGPAPPGEPPELHQVQPVHAQAQRVPGGAGLDQRRILGTEPAAQPADQVVQLGLRGSRWVLPQPGDEQVGGAQPVGVDEQRGEHQPRAPAPGGQEPALRTDLDRSQNCELHRPLIPHRRR